MNWVSHRTVRLSAATIRTRLPRPGVAGDTHRRQPGTRWPTEAANVAAASRQKEDLRSGAQAASAFVQSASDRRGPVAHSQDARAAIGCRQLGGHGRGWLRLSRDRGTRARLRNRLRQLASASGDIRDLANRGALRRRNSDLRLAELDAANAPSHSAQIPREGHRPLGARRSYPFAWKAPVAAVPVGQCRVGR
jgi:hypothetical protein